MAKRGADEIGIGAIATGSAAPLLARSDPAFVLGVTQIICA